ncbi:hypothetical protein B4N89_01420 [Embleya scabrispora]|uniref:Uncharacterized protein n=1 Tax=Embleya scabrispora TaxID=159449 RepID=A0A1T3NT28_9ACTN|nr:hypothetical protein [Embleya scabrispora]OPC79781.1 hypothetical protein B4N89_01420 [Embleya scabrispora]
MSDRPVIRAHHDGRTIELPGTLHDIRIALPEHERAQFDHDIAHAHIDNLPAVASAWAKTPEMRAHDDAIAARVAAGDNTGLFNADGTPAGET